MSCSHGFKILNYCWQLLKEGLSLFNDTCYTLENPIMEKTHVYCSARFLTQNCIYCSFLLTLNSFSSVLLCLESTTVRITKLFTDHIVWFDYSIFASSNEASSQMALFVSCSQQVCNPIFNWGQAYVLPLVNGKHNP
jgi:hypothetical protein